MKLSDVPWPFWAGAGVLAVILVNKLTGGALVRKTVEAIPQAAVDAGVGLVYGIGDAVGIPRTEQSECEKLLAAGDYWNASFKCPAGDFVGGVWGAVFRNQPADVPPPVQWGGEGRPRG